MKIWRIKPGRPGTVRLVINSKVFKTQRYDNCNHRKIIIDSWMINYQNLFEYKKVSIDIRPDERDEDFEPLLLHNGQLQH